VQEWVELLGDPDYKIVEQTMWMGGGHNYMISTVWLGLDQNLGKGGDPIIFETMIFEKMGTRDTTSTLLARYSTLEAAEAGHKRFVADYAGKSV